MTNKQPNCHGNYTSRPGKEEIQGKNNKLSTRLALWRWRCLAYNAFNHCANTLKEANGLWAPTMTESEGDSCAIFHLAISLQYIFTVHQEDNNNVEPNPNELNCAEHQDKLMMRWIHGCWRVNIAKQRLHRYWAVFITFFALGHAFMTTDTGTTQPLFSQHLAGAVNLMQGLIVHIIHFQLPVNHLISHTMFLQVEVKKAENQLQTC